jgi:SnoaL-like polyketide cyclase
MMNPRHRQAWQSVVTDPSAAHLIRASGWPRGGRLSACWPAPSPGCSRGHRGRLGEGDKVTVRHRFRGTQLGPLGAHPASRRTLTAEYIAIYRLVDGVIVEAWAEWDNLSGLTQLGHYLPPQ